MYIISNLLLANGNPSIARTSDMTKSTSFNWWGRWGLIDEEESQNDWLPDMARGAIVWVGLGLAVRIWAMRARHSHATRGQEAVRAAFKLCPTSIRHAMSPWHQKIEGIKTQAEYVGRCRCCDRLNSRRREDPSIQRSIYEVVPIIGRGYNYTTIGLWSGDEFDKLPITISWMITVHTSKTHRKYRVIMEGVGLVENRESAIAKTRINKKWK
jgi:hypothetical protein